MGIKSDKKSTSDQARLQRLTADGVSGTEEDMQLMLKTIIETTGCTQAQAEIALLDRDNNLYGAIDHILEAGDKLDSWTEQKGPKKEKKKAEESGSFNSRTFQGRGRGGGTGGFTERGGRGRSNGAPRESRDRDQNRENRGENREPRENRDTREVRGDRGDNKEGGFSRPSRGGFERPFVGRGGGRGGRGGYSRAVAPSSTIEPDAFATELDENSTKVDTNVTEVQPPVEESVTATVPTSSAPAPISFAAVAAAAHRKEALRKQQAQNPQPSAPPRRSLSPQPPLPSQAVTSPVKEDPVEEPSTFAEEQEPSSYEQDEGYFQNEEPAEEQTPNVSTHHDDNVQSSPEANQAWTNQLKSSLGIGIHETQEAQLSPVPAPVQMPDPGVEFVGTTAPTNIHDYSFGFVDAPPSPQPLPPQPAETSATSISSNNENLFNASRMMPKQVEPERTTLPNGDYNLKSSSPPLGYSNRGLSYDTSSSSYAPTDRMASSNKFNNPGQLPQQSTQQQQVPQQQPAQQQQQPTPPSHPQQHPQQQPQHMLFTPQIPYGYMNSYMNMYNPMGGVRDDQYAALMQYGMGVDLSNLSTILPQSGSQSLNSTASQVQQAQQGQRETHGLMDFNKFGSQQSARDQQSQQPSNVGPPPGFQANTYMQQPNLSSLFMQQPYGNPHTFPFMAGMNMGMQNVGSNTAGRPMYGRGDDEKGGYDKMTGGAKPTSNVPNVHSQYQQQQQQQHNGGNLGKYGNMNNKPYNWGN